MIEVFIEQNPVIVILLAVWALLWKGFALWKASGRQDKWWFITLFLIQTFGILDILYIYIFSKRKNKSSIAA